MRKRMISWSVVFMLLSGSVLPAQEEAESANPTQRPENEVTIAGVVVQQAPGSPAAAANRDAPRPIKDVLPEAKKIEGMFNLYQKKDKLYAEITGANLNTDYLIAMAIAKGSGNHAIGGFTVGFGDDWLWQFRKVNDRIQVVRRNIRFKADSGTPEAKAVEIAFSDSILYSLPILAKGESGGDVIDLATIFMADLPRVGSGGGGLGSGSSASFARDRSDWGEVKGFKNNVEIRVDATYASFGGMSGYDYGYSNVAAPDGKTFGVTIHYSISRLPSSGYSPRLADERIGFFTTSHKNFSKNQKDDYFIRYINRWNLQKADPSAPLSPPKKPVIFWIEKTVPFKYRNAVREGILEWNKAYEKVGIVNAIEVRQQSDTDTWDPEDINYNTFRWITADAGFAMGPSHVNPLTGEILDADIILDAGFIDSWKRSFDIFITETIPAISPEKSKLENLRELLNAYEKHEDARQDAHHGADHKGNEHAMNHCTCNYSQHRSSQMMLASLVFAMMLDEEKPKEEKKDAEKKDSEKKDAEKKDEAKEEKKDGDKKEGEEAKKDDAKKEGDKSAEKKDEPKKPSKEEMKKKAAEAFEKLVLEGLKDVVMHEVGHTLGLRHNFKASAWLTLEEMNAPDRSKEFGIAGSVMDYLPINISPKGKPQGDYFMTTLGPYDYLAIEYGYKILGGGTEGEKKELRKIAARQSEKGMHYATDEDVLSYGPDPSVNRRDLGANPIDFAKASSELYSQLLPDLLDRAVEEGDNFSEVSLYYRSILSKVISANTYLAQTVGGYYINRDHRGDPNGRPPVQVVDAKRQREALKYLCDEVFSKDAYKISPELYNHFGTEKWIDWTGAYTVSSQLSMRSLLISAQLSPLRTMVNTTTLSRIDEMELRVPEGEDVLTVSELFESLTTAFFSELDQLKEGEFSAQKPAISLVRRNLQEYYYLMLADYVAGGMSGYASLPESVPSSARVQLISLNSNIQAVLSGKAKLDPASKAHLQNLNDRIVRVLEAKLERSAP